MWMSFLNSCISKYHIQLFHTIDGKYLKYLQYGSVKKQAKVADKLFIHLMYPLTSPVILYDHGCIGLHFFLGDHDL